MTYRNLNLEAVEAAKEEAKEESMETLKLNAAKLAIHASERVLVKSLEVFSEVCQAQLKAQNAENLAVINAVADEEKAAEVVLDSNAKVLQIFGGIERLANKAMDLAAASAGLVPSDK